MVAGAAGNDTGGGHEPARLTGAAALRLHLTLAFGLALCVSAFCFEVLRALGGNELSWLYVFEWPIFAVFSVYMWWRLFNEPGRQASAIRNTLPSEGSVSDEAEADEDLEAWKRYLREMEDAEAKQQDRAY